MRNLEKASFGIGLAVLCLGGIIGCGSGDGQDRKSKEEVKAIGKADWGEDYCKVNGWYDDNVCDLFCPLPDPDCDRNGSCDDGRPIFCQIEPPTCDEGLILAYRHGCMSCVDPETCEAPEVRDTSCDDGKPTLCAMEPPTCDEGLILAYRHGCMSCVDPETCEAPDDGSGVGTLCDLESPKCAAGLLCYPKESDESPPIPICLYECSTNKPCPQIRPFTCIDYPLDSCDPDNGGVDCVGVCITRQ